MREPADAGAGGCDLSDGALDDAAFVIATAPAAGARVSSGFGVSGCSRTFESTVVWRLHARDGSLLGAGHRHRRRRRRPRPLRLRGAVQRRRAPDRPLEVFEEDVSGGEGFPPGRTVLPLVLLP